jgi:hypothetical protein
MIVRAKSRLCDAFSGGRLVRLAGVTLLAAVLSTSAGCANFGSVFGGSESGSAEGLMTQAPMTQARMEQIFGDQVDAIEGPSGAIRTIVDEVEIYLISDPTSDRMRLLAWVADVNRVDPRIVNVLLQANFYRTLDARYAVSEGIVFSAYLHPISTLSREELISGFDQVLALAKNFGTTYSSGKLDFGIPGAGAR